MEDIHDIKGLMPVPPSWWWLWALLALIAVVVFVWWLRSRRKPATTAGPASLPSPVEVALAALQRLREENPPVEVFYTRLSHIVRRYLEDRFGLRAPERTTEEFLYEVSQDGTLRPGHKELLGAFLQEADLVKFARLRPSATDTDRAYGAAEKFVRETES